MPLPNLRSLSSGIIPLLIWFLVILQLFPWAELYCSNGLVSYMPSHARSAIEYYETIRYDACDRAESHYISATPLYLDTLGRTGSAPTPDSIYQPTMRFSLHYDASQLQFYRIPHFSHMPKRSLSLSLWIFPEDPLPEVERVLWHYGNDLVYKLRRNGDTVLQYIGQEFVTTTASIPFNQWTQSTVLIDTDQAFYEEYLNGTLTKRVNLRFRDTAHVMETTHDLTFGINPFNTSDPHTSFQGQMRDSMIFNRLLSLDEISVLSQNASQFSVDALSQINVQLNLTESQLLNSGNFFCFGKRANETDQVCSGAGSCRPPGDSCECNSDRASYNCKDMKMSNCPQYMMAYFTGDDFGEICGSAAPNSWWHMEVDPSGKVGGSWHPSPSYLASQDANVAVHPLPQHIWRDFTQFSIAFWIKGNGGADSSPHFLSYSTSEHNNHILFFLNNDGSGQNNVRLTLMSTSISYSSFSDHMSDFVHYVFTWDSLDGSVTVFRNGASIYNQLGVLVGQDIPAGGSLLFFNDQDTVGGSTSAGQRFSGWLDEIIFFNRTLTSAEVTTLYDKNGRPFHTCDSKYPNHALVCHGHGTCLDQDYCTCEAPYTGQFCEVNSQLISDNRVYSMGSNEFGKNGFGSSEMRTAVSPEQIKRYTSLLNEHIDRITCGENHCVLFTSSGGLYSFGQGDKGQLGLNDRLSRNEATRIDSFSMPSDDTTLPKYRVRSMCASATRTLLLTENHSLLTFGEASALGNSSLMGSDALVPVRVAKSPMESGSMIHSDDALVQVACGYHHALVLTSKGLVHSWGGVGITAVSDIPLGTGSTMHEFPTLIPDLTEIVSITSGFYHALALDKRGQVYSWGRGGQGQNGLAGVPSLTPSLLNLVGFSSVRAVFAGADSSFVLGTQQDSSLDKLVAFGDNKLGLLGIGREDVIYQMTPAEVDLRFWEGSTARARVSTVSISSTNSYIISEGGILFATGSNEGDALGVWSYPYTNRTLFRKTSDPYGWNRHSFGDVTAKKNGALLVDRVHCSGISSTKRETVCSSHGDCLGIDSCQCDYGYDTQLNSTLSPSEIVQCDTVMCFGIMSNNDSVCSGHGSCHQVDNCTCLLGYSAEMCSNFSCWGIPSWNISGVCNGAGSCVDKDTCACFPGYSGDKCERFSCFGVDHQNNEEVCSKGAGVCVRPDTCRCHPEYWGARCQYLVARRPIAILDSSNIVGPCDSLQLDASRSVGASLHFVWNLTEAVISPHTQTPGNFSLHVQSIKDYLFNQSTEVVLIPPHLLYSNVTYRFSVTVQDVNDLWSLPSDVSSVFIAEEDVLTMFSSTRKNYNILREDSLTLTATAQGFSLDSTCNSSLPNTDCSCSSIAQPIDPSTVSYTWSSVPDVLSMVEIRNHELVIPPHSIPYGNYSFVLEASTHILSTSQKIVYTVNVASQALVAYMQPSLVKIPKSQSIVLDATQSHDPDQLTSVSEVYEWDCTLQNGTHCIEIPSLKKDNLLENILDAASYKKTLLLSAFVLPVGMYDFHFRYTKGIRSSNTTTRVHVLDSVEDSAWISFEFVGGLSSRVDAQSTSDGFLQSYNLNNVNPSEKLSIRAVLKDGSSTLDETLQSPQWRQVQGPSIMSRLLVTHLKSDRLELSFAPNTLQEGTTYAFEFSASVKSSNAPVLSQVQLTTAYYPGLGSLRVLPLEGIQSETLFSLHAVGWSSRNDPDAYSGDDPLQYQFEYIHPRSGEVIVLRAFSSQHFISNVILPFASESLAMRVRVKNRAGAISYSTQTLTVRPFSQDIDRMIGHFANLSSIAKAHQFSSEEQLNYLQSGILLMNQHLCNETKCNTTQRTSLRETFLQMLSSKNQARSSNSDWSLSDVDTLVLNLHAAVGERVQTTELSTSAYEMARSLATNLACVQRAGASGQTSSKLIVQIASSLFSYARNTISSIEEEQEMNREWQHVVHCLASSLSTSTVNGERLQFSDENYGLAVHKDIARFMRTSEVVKFDSVNLEVKLSPSLAQLQSDFDSVTMVMLRLARNPHIDDTPTIGHSESNRKSEIAELYFLDATSNKIDVQNLSQPLELRFHGSYQVSSSSTGKQFKEPTGSSASCVYFDSLYNSWNTTGMSLNYISYNTLSCFTRHTTLFAVHALEPPVEESPEPKSLAEEVASLWWLYMVLGFILIGCVCALCIVWICGVSVVGSLCLQSYRKTFPSEESKVEEFGAMEEEASDDDDGYNDEEEEKREELLRYFAPAPAPEEVSSPHSPSSGEYSAPRSLGQEEYWLEMNNLRKARLQASEIVP